MLLNCGVGEDSWESLGLQGDQTSQSQRKSTLNILGSTLAEAEAPILWPPDAKSGLIGKDPHAGKDWRQEGRGMTEDEMVGWHHRLDGHESEQVPGEGDGQGSLACCSPWGHKDHTQTPLSNWTPPLHNNNNGIKNNIKASTLYNRELLLNENRVSVWDDEKVLRMNGGDGCTTLWMYWMPLNRSLGNNSSDKFYAMCFLPQWKKCKKKKSLTSSFQSST